MSDQALDLDRALELAKKRAAQFSQLGGGDEASPAKRHLGGGGDIHLKLLIPSNVAGQIIGKGGATIAELRRASGTHIIMSKNTEVFPGTQDRVSLITGPKAAISVAVQLLVKKMKERYEEFKEREPELERTVKVVVPNSTISKVIGKGGEVVEDMKQRSGSKIAFTNKDEQPQVDERVITLIGEMRGNQIALDMILEKVCEDPNALSCGDIHYEGMGAQPSNTYYSRKSSVEAGEEYGTSPSRRHSAVGSGGDIHLKMLIPSNVAGQIIGKGGETIAELRRASGTHMIMSKNTEVFPGTQDRVALITGPKDAISDACQLLIKKMKDRYEEFREREPELERTVKVVVPNSTIGKVIGKGGETVEEMKQRSGSKIVFTKKDEQPQVDERVITLIGETRGNQIALDMILEQVVKDPNSGSCGDIHYGGDGGTPGSQPSGGYGYGSRGGSAGPPAAAAAAPGYDTINVNGHTNLRLTMNMSTPIPPDPWVSSQAMPHINYALRQAGHSPTVADELTRAFGLQAAHGVLQLSQSAAAVAEVATGWAGEQAVDSTYGYGAQPAPPGQTKTGLPYPRPATPPGESSGPPMEEEVQVDERLMGAVLGHGGKNIIEIKQYSGADVQVSKRGVYHPGTTNRVVTIKGSQRAVQSAVYMVNQKVQEKQDERRS